MSDGIDREYEGMAENLVKSLKHFAEKLDTAVARGDISEDAKSRIRTNVMEGMSVYMMTTSTLVKPREVPPQSE